MVVRDFDTRFSVDHLGESPDLFKTGEKVRVEVEHGDASEFAELFRGEANFFLSGVGEVEEPDVRGGRALVRFNVGKHSVEIGVPHKYLRHVSEDE